MPSGPPRELAAIRHAYEETSAAADDICARFALDKPALRKLARSGRWRRKHPQPFPAGRYRRRPDASGPGQPAGGETSPPGALGAAPAGAALPPDGERTAAPSTSASPRRPMPSSAAARRRLLGRMVAAISLKLEQLERRMTHNLAESPGSDPQSATDHERETRAIGALIDNLGKITEIEGGQARSAGGKGAAAAAADLAGDADRFRRELAERLRRIVGAAAGTP